VHQVAKGENNQAIGRSRGGRTTKIHALTDSACRPIAFMLTGGQVADCTAGEQLLEQMPQAFMLHGDKGYDSNAIRRQVENKGVMPNIPPKANRHWKNCFSPFLYRNRNAIERMFGRLKDFRRIAPTAAGFEHVNNAADDPSVSRPSPCRPAHARPAYYGAEGRRD